jgi:hypothetical protein
MDAGSGLQASTRTDAFAFPHFLNLVAPLRPRLWGAAVALGVFASLGSAQAQTQDCSLESNLRSATTGAPVELSFRNASGVRKRLYWIDYDGERKFYTVVEPGNVYRQQTSSGHTWVVADDAEKCQTLVVAPAAPTTVDIGGPATAQMAPPAPGVQQSIQQQVQQPVVQAPVSQQPPVQLDPVAQASGAAQIGQPMQAAAEPLPQVSPIEQFQLSGAYRVASRGEAGKFLNAQGSGGVEVARVKPEWDSTQWVFEPVPGSPFVRIKSRWKNTYLTDVNGALRATNATPDAVVAHWTFEPVDGTNYIQFRNRETDRFLLSANNAAALADDFRQDQEAQTHWQVDSAARTAAAPPAPPRTAAYVAYDSALLNCRQIGGYWTGSSCRAPQRTVILSCQPGWVWAPDMGECLWDGGGRCPPWQMSPNGLCVSDLSCRGGRVRISGRGYPVCDCPLGTVTWGNYPNLSCVPSVARVLPLLLGAGATPGFQPGFQGRPKVGQGFGNTTFGTGVFGQGGGRPQFGGTGGGTPVNVTPGPAGTPTIGVVTTPAACPAGQTGTPPNCRPATTTPTTPPAACPAGTTGTPPNCTQVATTPAACPAGSTGTPPNCKPTAVATCPAGQAGTPPNCQAPVVATCPAGQTGTPPNCRTATTAPNAPCAPWQTGVPGACIDKKVVCNGGNVQQGHCICSSGFVPSGFNDNFTCQPRSTAACPAGSTGTPPNCKPTGTATTPTTPATCPAGTTGTPPNCTQVATTPAACPTGQTGTPPNCRTATTAPNAPCAPWQTGVPGACVDKKVVCNGGNVQQGHCICSSGFIASGFNDNFTCQPRSTAACPAGTTGTPPNCKPTTTVTTNPQGTGLTPAQITSINACRNNPRLPGCDEVLKTNPGAATCPAGSTGTPPNCKPTTTVTTNPQGTGLTPAQITSINACRNNPRLPGCDEVLKANPGPNAVTSCPTGTTGTPPNCRPGTGAAGGAVVPIRAATCPAGQTGTPPNCQLPVVATCPAGQTGTPPNCRPPVAAACPAGMTGTPPNCKPPVAAACPAGMTGTPPNCRPPVAAACPAGMTGTPPNCKPPVAAACPAGMTGTPPNCRPPVAAACPAGMTGTPPNCRPPVAAACPAGMTGTPPNCRPPVAAACPAGMTGTPPNCKR